MKPNPQLHNQAQKEALAHAERTGIKRTVKIAVVTCPDGTWSVAGGLGPESEKMSKALQGTPDGSMQAWVAVEIYFPRQTVNPVETPQAEEAVAQWGQPDFVSSETPTGTFVGPGGPLPVIDLEVE